MARIETTIEVTVSVDAQLDNDGMRILRVRGLMDSGHYVEIDPRLIGRSERENIRREIEQEIDGKSKDAEEGLLRARAGTRENAIRAMGDRLACNEDGGIHV